MFTLRELARDAGVTHNAPYRHFATKDALLAALRDEGFARLAATEREALEAAGSDARARVQALGEAYVRFALVEPVAFRLMMDAPVDSTEATKPTESFDLLRDTLEAAQRAGAVRTDLPARELALVAWSLVHGLASLLAAGRLPSSAARVRRYSQSMAAVFFEGVGLQP